MTIFRIAPLRREASFALAARDESFAPLARFFHPRSTFSRWILRYVFFDGRS